MTADDKDIVATFPFDAAEEQHALGVLGFMGEAGFGPLEHRWYRPTLEVVGIWGGFTGAAQLITAGAQKMQAVNGSVQYISLAICSALSTADIILQQLCLNGNICTLASIL
jgi:hypothetical protein